MPIIQCVECGNNISEYANSCSYCGCPMNIIKEKINNGQKYIQKIYSQIVQFGQYSVSMIMDVEKGELSITSYNGTHIVNLLKLSKIVNDLDIQHYHKSGRKEAFKAGAINALLGITAIIDSTSFQDEDYDYIHHFNLIFKMKDGSSIKCILIPEPLIITLDIEAEQEKYCDFLNLCADKMIEYPRNK